MKRKYLITFIILFAIFSLLPIILFVTWFFQPKLELKITILDKTAITKDVNEHKSLNWVLTNDKYCKLNRSLYSEFEDYYGFFPQEEKKYFIRDFESYNDSLLKLFADKTDMIYVSDTYGIYRKEWHSSNYRGEYSQLMYGGMSQKEFNLIKILKEQKKLIITEYNSFATPTPASVRIQFENTFGLKWSGWTGRYIDDLDTLRNKEIPVWLIKDYKSQHKNQWPFKKAGIALVHESGRVEILDHKRDLKDEVPHIFTNERNQKKFGIPDKFKYPYWFDIVLTKRSNNVTSLFYIDANSRGDSVLNSLNIPNPFPAIIEHYDDDYKFYYFCGDFTDNPIDMLPSKFAFVTKFKWLFYSAKDPGERDSFFWEFYQPLVSGILKNYYYSLPRQ